MPRPTATHHATHDEPLTLFRVPELAAVYDRRAILRAREEGRPARQEVDVHIAKVLPRGSLVAATPAAEGVVRVLDSRYRPYYRRPLYAVAELLAPAGRAAPGPPPPAPPPAMVIERLLGLEGAPYLYGGSAVEGSPAQREALLARGLFDPRDAADPELDRIMTSTGLDCSGLFNVATGYAFFGDTRHLYHRFAAGLREVPPRARRDPAAVAEHLRPLDVLLYRGHMIVALGDDRVIQAVGDGYNARTFCEETGHAGPPLEKYDRVRVDDAEPILRALLIRQGRSIATEWRLDDHHLMIVRYPGDAE